MKNALWAIVIIQAAVIAAIFFILLPFLSFDGVVAEYPGYRSALQVALQLGRLDLVTPIVTFIGILFGLFAIIGFGYVTSKAEAVAKEAAVRAARETADAAATKRVDETIGETVAYHLSLLGGETGDEIAENVDPGNDD